MKVRLGTISAALGVGGRPGGRGESVGIGGQQVDTGARRREGEEGDEAFSEGSDESAAINTPLPAAPPSGKTVVYLQCDNPSCASSGADVSAAVTTLGLGWTYKSIPFKLADTSTFISAMDSALEFKPAFVVFTGVPEATWAGRSRNTKPLASESSPPVRAS